MSIMKTNTGGALLEFGYSEDKIHDVLSPGLPITVPVGPFKISPTKNRLYWGFPIRFWIVLASVVGIGIILAIGVGFIVGRKKPKEDKNPYQAVPNGETSIN